jgi:hypothetical protein
MPCTGTVPIARPVRDNMKIGRFEISKWQYSDKPEFVCFEYINAPCKCRFLTICNLLFILYNKECQKEGEDSA